MVYIRRADAGCRRAECGAESGGRVGGEGRSGFVRVCIDLECIDLLAVWVYNRDVNLNERRKNGAI